jgi:hypothetical protein
VWPRFSRASPGAGEALVADPLGPVQSVRGGEEGEEFAGDGFEVGLHRAQGLGEGRRAPRRGATRSAWEASSDDRFVPSVVEEGCAQFAGSGTELGRPTDQLAGRSAARSDWHSSHSSLSCPDLSHPWERL